MMSSDYYGIVEMVFSFGVVIAFAIWQLISLERHRKRLRDKAKASDQK